MIPAERETAIAEEDIEAVAKAMYKARHEGLSNCYPWDDTDLDHDHPDCRPSLYRDAKAAIKTIRALASAPSEAVGRGEEIDYTNYRGERSIRRIVPISLFFGTNEWHTEQQWLLLAYDIEKQERRTFALSGLHTTRIMVSLPTADRDAIREALKPFAALAERLDPRADDVWDALRVTIKNGDLRRAAAALALLGEG